MAAMPDRPLPADADVEQHRARIAAAVDDYVAQNAKYIDEVVRRYAPHTRWRLGACTGLNTGAKTATVTLEPVGEAEGQDGVVCGWGRKTWSAGQLVGKRVRVMVDIETSSHWIDDVVA